MSSIQNTSEKHNDDISDNDFRVLESRYKHLLSAAYEYFYQIRGRENDEDLDEIVRLVEHKFEQYRDSLSNLLSTSPRPSYFQCRRKAIYIAQCRWLKVLEAFLYDYH